MVGFAAKEIKCLRNCGISAKNAVAIKPRILKNFANLAKKNVANFGAISRKLWV